MFFKGVNLFLSQFDYKLVMKLKNNLTLKPFFQIGKKF